jgi:hypothetical protein
LVEKHNAFGVPGLYPEGSPALLGLPQAAIGSIFKALEKKRNTPCLKDFD